MSKLKKIIHLADLHYYNVKRHKEYKIVLTDFIKELQDIKDKTHDGDIAVLIAGDLVHQKIQVTNELLIQLSWFLKSVCDICDVIVYAGNHDFIMGNKDRVDTLTAVINILNDDRIKYVDKLLDYKSGVYEYKGVNFCLYSIFEDYSKPDLIPFKNNGNKMVGLFHGAITGSETDSGYTLEHGSDGSMFEGCQVVMAGDIHKRQEIRHKGVRIVYAGSTIQQDYGENITKHGYLVWDVDTLRYTEHELDNPFKFYKFKINSIKELENDEEILINI